MYSDSAESPDPHLHPDPDRKNLGALSRPPLRIVYTEALGAETASCWLREYSTWFADTTAAVDRGRSRAQRVRKRLGAWDVIIKREVDTLWGAALRAARGLPSRSERAFHIGVGLDSAKVGAARPLAVIERRWLALVLESSIVVQFIEALNLREFVLNRLKPMTPEGEKQRVKRELLGKIAGELARLHRAGVRQRDLKAPNILIEDPEGSARVRFIDLEGMSHLSKPPSLRVRIRDLSRLLVSLREPTVAAAGIGHEDWWFLVMRYLAEVGSETCREEVDTVVRRTARWAVSKEKRNRRRQRPIA